MPDRVEVLEGAEAFTLGTGPVGVLLVHGFTGCPQSLKGLGEHLAGLGMAVACPRLPGHGTTWQDLNTRRGPEWEDAIEQAFEAMAAEHDRIFCVCMSFGAALGLLLAARHPDGVAGLVTLAGFVESRDPRRHFAPVVRRLVASLPGVANDIADPTQREIAYDRLPTGATHEMFRVLRRARDVLPQVRCPILVMHSRNDHTVLPHNAETIYELVGSQDKEIVWFERSYHVLTLDYDRDEVLERTADFIRRRSGTR